MTKLGPFAGALAIAALSTSLMPKPAVACGGLFCNSAQPVNQSAERIIFSHNGDGTVTLALLRPITPGEATLVTYTSTTGITESCGTFISLPANVDGGGETDAGDVLALVDNFKGVQSLLWGDEFGCNVNHSKECNPRDLLGLIDVLVGAGALGQWSNARMPLSDCP